MNLLIVIPAYNEESNIVGVVTDLTQRLPEYDYVVVNDGSVDATAMLCRKNHFNLIDLPVNLGLSGAFQAGIKYAYQNNYDAVLQYDADGQHQAEFIPKMLDVMQIDNLDIVIGSRYVNVKKPKSLRMFGSYLISLATFLTTGKLLCDPTSGMRLLNKTMIKEFAFDANYAPEPDTISYLIKNGAKIKEVQVEMSDRVAGESYLNLSRSIKYMLNMGISIIFIQWFRKRKKAVKKTDE